MKPNLLKLILPMVILGAVAATGFYFVLLSQVNHSEVAVGVPDKLFGWKFPATEPSVNRLPIAIASPGPGQNLFDIQIAFSDIRDPGGIPQGLPVRLKVPVIHVDSAIEDAYITPDGRMDVPQGSVNVAWFALGPKPGQVGSAVIGGHFGINGGVKFVFYDLDKLVVGDKIYVVDDKGDTLAFQVRRIQLFNREADATTVFTSNDGLAHLNLITCEGIWNRVNDTYPQRRVVFTDAIPFEGSTVSNPPAATKAPFVIQTPLPTKSPTITTALPILRLGTRGADVVKLQTSLIQKGFLTIPRGYTKGYYGTLTLTAVKKYQKVVGLPATGIFDATTRTRLYTVEPPALANPNIPTATHEPALPSTALATPTPSTLPEIIVQTAKSLFATPLDSIITSILLILIIYMAFKLISR